MKKINIFYIILVVLALAVTAVVLVRDVRNASLTGGKAGVDTVYVTKTVVVHDTIYIEKSFQKELSPVEAFADSLGLLLKEEFAGFYSGYKELTDDNLDKAKAEFKKCEERAKERYQQMKKDFLEKYPEETDRITEMVSREVTNSIKPYLHMLNEYGSRKK